MKKLFIILLVTVVASCDLTFEPKRDIITSTIPPTSNTDYENIIGITFKIDNLEVAEYDFPKSLTFENAKAACTELGEGWRLPTKDELNLLYQNKEKIGRPWSTYWSSTESGVNSAWNQRFTNGEQKYNWGYEFAHCMVRAVKAL